MLNLNFKIMKKVFLLLSAIAMSLGVSAQVATVSFDRKPSASELEKLKDWLQKRTKEKQLELKYIHGQGYVSHSA